MDFTATLLALAGVSRPDLRLEGIDLMPALTAGPTAERTLFWRVTGRPTQAARRTAGRLQVH